MIWRRRITLTIDDGPSDATPQLLDRLRGGGHRAVLFILGYNVAGRDGILVEALRQGFALGNHSFRHPRFSSISVEEARREIEETETLIDDLYRRAGAPRPGKWFRFPFLDFGEERAPELQTLLRDLGFERPRSLNRCLPPAEAVRLDWPTTLCTFDWELPPEDEFRGRLRRARPLEVVEFHDQPETVARYSQALVEELARRSLRARVPEGAR